MEMNALPMYSGSYDNLRHGIHSLENEFLPNHPIKIINNNKNQWIMKLDNVRRSYGSSLAMRLATEKETFSRSHRLPGLESSNISLQTLLGNDEIIEFSDVLNGNKYIIVENIDHKIRNLTSSHMIVMIVYVLSHNLYI